MDYDVSAVALSIPPVDASLTTYRPAILVRNNGRFSAVASGVIQAYKAGLRVFSSPITSPTIAPGETGIATAANDWLPESQGDYILFGYVSTYRDQVEPNNNLAPVTIHVGPEPPTPPPTVPQHAPQHEHGGSDSLSVEDLPGVLADPQPAEPHASSHQAGGDDTLNISGLAGVASDPQIPTNHGNEHHNPDFATSAELANHQNAASVHTAATNLANRDTSGPESGLVPSTQLALGSTVLPDGKRYLGDDRLWHAPVPTNLICIWNGSDPVPAGWLTVAINPAPPLPYIYIRREADPA